MAARNPLPQSTAFGNWFVSPESEDGLQLELDLNKIREKMLAMEERAFLNAVLHELRRQGFTIIDPEAEKAKAEAPDGGRWFGDDSELGWWEYGDRIEERQETRGGDIRIFPAKIAWYPTRELAESAVDRFPETHTLVRRWVQPEPWQIAPPRAPEEQN